MLTEDEGAVRLEEIRRVTNDEDKWNMDKSFGEINTMSLMETLFQAHQDYTIKRWQHL